MVFLGFLGDFFNLDVGLEVVWMLGVRGVTGIVWLVSDRKI